MTRGCTIGTIAMALAAVLWLRGAAHAQPASVPAARAASAAAASLPAPGPAATLPVAPLVTKKARVLASKHQRQYESKHETERAETRAALDEERKRWHAHLDRRLGRPPAEVISIFNTWTHEYLPVERAESVPEERIDRFFRCHFTNDPTDMDAHLFGALVDTARHFGAERIDIVSGYRAPKYNLMLRKKGREVARKSQHTLGSAIDFRLPGVPVARLHAWIRRLRLGGVGFYPSSGFVHMDTGPVRYWRGR